MNNLFFTTLFLISCNSNLDISERPHQQCELFISAFPKNSSSSNHISTNDLLKMKNRGELLTDSISDCSFITSFEDSIIVEGKNIEESKECCNKDFRVVILVKTETSSKYYFISQAFKLNGDPYLFLENKPVEFRIDMITHLAQRLKNEKLKAYLKYTFKK